MIDIPDADKMAVLANSGHKNFIKRQHENVIKSIKDAAADGFRKVTVHIIFTDDFIKDLINHGYEVSEIDNDFNGQLNDEYDWRFCTIRW